jgi:hypothetical protein
MGVPRAHQAETEAAVPSPFSKAGATAAPAAAMPTPRPPQQCPRRARRSDAHAAPAAAMPTPPLSAWWPAAPGEGGSAGASSPPRQICAAARTQPPGRGRRRGHCCWRACVSLAGPDQNGFLQQCAAEAQHSRYFFGDGALLVGQAVLGDRRSQSAGLRCGSAPTVVLINNTDKRANSRSMAKPPAVGGWFSNLTPAMRCYTFATEAHL